MLKLKRKYVINLFVLALTILNLYAYSENKVLLHKALGNGKRMFDKLNNQEDNVLNLEGTKNTRYLGIYNDIEGRSLIIKPFYDLIIEIV